MRRQPESGVRPLPCIAAFLTIGASIAAFAGCSEQAGSTTSAMVMAANERATKPAADPASVARGDAFLKAYRSAAGRSAATPLESLQGEGLVSRLGSQKVEARWWVVFQSTGGYQSGRWVRHEGADQRFVGEPTIYGLWRGSPWVSMSGFTMMRPYVEPGRSVPRNPDATNRRREVLTTALGIVPEWAIDNSITEFTYAGTTTFDDIAVARFEVADSDGPFGEMYFDSRSHLPIAYRYRFVNGATGAEVFEIMRYQQYRATAGVVLPTRILRTGCDTPMDQSAKFEVKTYRVNAPVDYDLLRPPDGGRGALRVPPVL